MVLQNKFYTQYRNGEFFTDNLSDFSTVLVGSVNDTIKKVTEFSYSLKSVASAPFEFTVDGNTLTFNGDFVDDGFVVNDFVDLYDDGGASFIFQDREIFLISANQIIFNGAPVAGPITVTDGRLILKTEMTSFKHRFGLIGLNEPINYVSKVDSIAENIYLADDVGLDSGGGRSTIPVPMNPVAGVKSWQSDVDEATVAYVSTGSLVDDFAQVFEVVHIFKIMPFYLDGQLPNIQGNIKPALFVGVDTIKYVSETSFASQQFLIDGSRKVDIDSTNAAVGWFGENKNGLNPEYSLLSVVFQDAANLGSVDGIQLDKKTKVTVIIESTNSLFDADKHVVQLGVAHSSLNYQQNNKTIDENFLNETIFNAVENGVLNGARITNFETEIPTPQYLQIYFDYEMNSTDAALADGLNSIIMATVADKTISNNSTDRVAVVSTALNIESSDVEDLIFMKDMYFHPQDSDLNGAAFNNIAGWLEDGFIADFNFQVNADQQSLMSSLILKLAVYNNSTGEYFHLQQIPFNVGNATIVSGMQYYNQNTPSDVNAFILPEDSDWKKKQLVTTGPAMNSGFNVIEHNLTCGMRLNYESWIALPGADTFFYDTSLPNNGLNLNSSRFDDSPFEVVVIMEAGVSGADKSITDYAFISQPFGVETYSKDGNVPAGWSGVVNLFDENDVSVPYVLSNQNTKVKVVFTKAAAAPVITDLWGRIRMYQENTTINDAYEIGTYEDPLSANNPLIPALGETRLKTTNGGTTIELEAMIDGSLINDGEFWVVTGRIGEQTEELVFTAAINTTFIGGTSGLWDFDFNFSEAGGAPLSNKDIYFKVFNDDTDEILADVVYKYGDFPQVDPPQVDNIGNWSTAVQPFIQAGTEFVDGGSGGFTKLDWGLASKNVDDAFFDAAKVLRVELSIASSPEDSDLMGIEEQEIGVLTNTLFMHYSPAIDSYFFSRQVEPLAIEMKIESGEFHSSTIYEAPAPNYFNTVGIDEINQFNGKPTIYTCETINVAQTYSSKLVLNYWNGLDGYVQSDLISFNAGCNTILPLSNFIVNGRPMIITSNSNYSGSFNPEFWRMFYFDGSQWQYNEFTKMLKTGLSAPNDKNHTMIMDDFGRLWFHRIQGNGGNKACRIDFLTYNGSGAFEDEANWSRTFAVGGQNNRGFADGVAGAVLMQSVFGFNIIGYDVNTYPIIQFYDAGNQALRQLQFDGISQFEVTTIAITTYEIIQMTWNGSEYMCIDATNGFLTMDLLGNQTLLNQGISGSRLNGVKY